MARPSAVREASVRAVRRTTRSWRSARRPSASTVSCSVSPTTAIRSGCAGTVVVPNLCSTVAGNAASAAGLSHKGAPPRPRGMRTTMTAADDLAGAFEAERPYLRRLAYSTLGSFADADDVVQEAWLRLQRADAGAIRDLRAWLTTTVGRLALDALRSARRRREQYVGPWLPEPLVEDPDAEDPAERVTLDESRHDRAARRARAALARGADRVRAARRVRAPVRRRRGGRRPRRRPRSASSPRAPVVTSGTARRASPRATRSTRGSSARSR